MDSRRSSLSGGRHSSGLMVSSSIPRKTRHVEGPSRLGLISRRVVSLCRCEGLMQDANAIKSAVYHGGLVHREHVLRLGFVPTEEG